MKIPDHVETTRGVMMNGDSLSSPNTELYELPPARQKMDIGIQFTPECLEQEKETCTTAPKTQLNHNISTPGRKMSVRRSTEEEEAIESAEEPVDISQPQTKISLETQEEVDGDSDKVDRKWPSLEPDQQDDDGCGVRCLSYTVQCCDCVIL